jgi:putative SOS response-associated peptidase YedK
MGVRDSRVHNYPPRWYAAPKQDLLVIRRNHQTGAVVARPVAMGLIPYWCEDPKGVRKPINAKSESSAPCRRVTRRISRTVFSALSGMRLLACLILAPRQGYDEPGFPS